MRLPRLVPLLAVATFLASAGCDTNNGGNSLRDVQGTYLFTELLFDPAAPALAEADVLTRIDEEETEVRLFSDGDALFLVQFDDNTSLRADGTVSATNSSVRLVAVTPDDAEELGRLLLQPTNVFARGGSGDVLTASMSVTVDLAAYDPENYPGLNAVSGTLSIRLERQ
ncbi:MAG TPA: hypothetical protein VK610_00250 [Rhodothermales bacterium]|nr:hypothetical protein [Rhodothermales bacterium]